MSNVNSGNENNEAIREQEKNEAARNYINAVRRLENLYALCASKEEIAEAKKVEEATWKRCRELMSEAFYR